MRVHHPPDRRPPCPATERWRTAAGHGRAARMARASKSPVAGGALIALAVIIGVTIGLVVGQPTQGFLIGTAIGIGMAVAVRSEEHTSELQSLMRISYAVFCLKKKNKNSKTKRYDIIHQRDKE